MDLIELYLGEVGRHLPLRSRRDIRAELRSVLQDMLDERAEAAGRPADDAMIFELLEAYGSPREVAASYVPERYLIGPQFFPIFKLVLTVVLSVMGAMALVGLGSTLARLDALTFLVVLEATGKALLDFAGIALQILGNLVLVFVVLQWAMPGFDETLEDETEWDPHSLLDVVPSERVSVAGKIAEIAATLVAILVFNFYSQYVALFFLQDGRWTFAPVLSDAFFRYLPLLTVFWGLEIILNIVLLRRGQWQPLTRWLSVGIELFGVGIGIAMLVGPPLVTLSTEALETIFASDPEAVALLVRMAGIGVRALIGLIIGLEFLDISKTVYWLVKNKKTPVLP